MSYSPYDEINCGSRIVVMDYYKWFEDKHRELEAGGTWANVRFWVTERPSVTSYGIEMDGRYALAGFYLWPAIAMEAHGGDVRDPEPSFYFRLARSTDAETLEAFWGEFYEVILKMELRVNP